MEIKPYFRSGLNFGGMNMMFENGISISASFGNPQFRSDDLDENTAETAEVVIFNTNDVSCCGNCIGYVSPDKFAALALMLSVCNPDYMNDVIKKWSDGRYGEKEVERIKKENEEKRKVNEQRMMSELLNEKFDEEEIRRMNNKEIISTIKHFRERVGIDKYPVLGIKKKVENFVEDYIHLTNEE